MTERQMELMINQSMIMREEPIKIIEAKVDMSMELIDKGNKKRAVTDQTKNVASKNI